VDVGTSTVLLVPYHHKRKSLVILNNGTADVYISNDPLEVSTRGLKLAPGVAVSETVAEGDEPYLQIYAEAVTGTQDVRIIEGYGPREETEAET
jgi:hypothetical protein